VPTLLTGGTIGELNGNGEQILDRKTHARLFSTKTVPSSATSGARGQKQPT
jgi:hypothetical protein